MTSDRRLRVAYLGNLYHHKTESMGFFVDLLQEHFDVDFYWGLPRNQCREIDAAKVIGGRYDVVLCWQVMLRPDVLRQMAPRGNALMVPMYDSLRSAPPGHMAHYRPFRFLTFCRALHGRLDSMGLRSRYVQYHPDPPAPRARSGASSAGAGNGLSVFFWQRRDEFTWEHVRVLLQGNAIERVHLHRAVDPGATYVSPSAEDGSARRITETDWFERRDEYLAAVDACDVFVAPRPWEGIGLAFLEAMARGKCVVAVDGPTMNEYIEHGSNGLLFDPQNLRPLDLSQHRKLGDQALRSAARGHAAWLRQTTDVIDEVRAAARRERGSWLSLLGRVPGLSKGARA